MRQIKKSSLLKLPLSLLLLFSLSSFGHGEPGVMRGISTMELVKDMGLGWNLGNTLEATGDWITGVFVSNYETAWGMPVTRKEMIDGLAAIGFKTVRIPVAWSNLMAPDYTIYPKLMERVEEVVNYVLDNNMYAIINIHWDGGWIKNASKDYDGVLKKYRAIWTQVAERFKDYSDYLIFEAMNEEGYYEDIWNPYSKQGDKKKAYGILNSLNQEFVDIVRASGGNNAKRHLLIAGYATDLYWTIDEEFKMPEDPVNRLAVSIHYYYPSTFTILENDASWGKAARTWGSRAEVEQNRRDMEVIKKHFVDMGIPVILGEYGATKKNKDIASVNKYILTVAEAALDAGICPILWDANAHYNRRTCSFNDKELEAGFRRLIEKASQR